MISGGVGWWEDAAGEEQKNADLHRQWYLCEIRLWRSGPGELTPCCISIMEIEQGLFCGFNGIYSGI